MNHLNDVQLQNIITQQVSLPLSKESKIKADVLRLDLVHETISGNKWFKLQYHLENLKKTRKHLVTFGGAWSNHLLATAAACRLHQVPVTGIVRGEKPKYLSPVLAFCEASGMQLVFTSRTDYAKKNIDKKFNDPAYYMVPEGGYSHEGMRGAATITGYFKEKNYTHICLAAGTGTTAAGLVYASSHAQIVVISVLKNNISLEQDIVNLAEQSYPFLSIHHDFSFGGYAKYDPKLIMFMNDLYRSTGIPTDFVYTGKLFYAVNALAEKNYFPINSKILIIHSGGLKGNASLGNGTLIF